MKINIPTSGYSYDRKVNDANAKLRIKCIGEYAVEVFIGVANAANAKTKIEPGQFADFAMRSLKLNIGTWGNGSMVSLFKLYPDGVEDACNPDGYADPASPADTVDTVARQKLSHINYNDTLQTTTITGTADIKKAQIHEVAYAAKPSVKWGDSFKWSADSVMTENSNYGVALVVSTSWDSSSIIPLGNPTANYPIVCGIEYDDSVGYPGQAWWAKVLTKGSTTTTKISIPTDWLSELDPNYYLNYKMYFFGQTFSVYNASGTKQYCVATADYVFGSSVLHETSVDLADYGWQEEDFGVYNSVLNVVYVDATPFNANKSSVLVAWAEVNQDINDSNATLLTTFFYSNEIAPATWYGVYQNNTSWKTWGANSASATLATYGTNLSNLVLGQIGRLKFDKTSFAVLPTDSANLGNLVITLKRNSVQVGTKTVPITASTWTKSGTKYQSPAIVMSVDDDSAGQKVYTLEVTASAGTLSTGAALGKITVEDIG